MDKNAIDAWAVGIDLERAEQRDRLATVRPVPDVPVEQIRARILDLIVTLYHGESVQNLQFDSRVHVCCEAIQALFAPASEPEPRVEQPIPASPGDRPSDPEMAERDSPGSPCDSEIWDAICDKDGDFRARIVCRLRSLFACHRRPVGTLDRESVRKILLACTTPACPNEQVEVAVDCILALTLKPEWYPLPVLGPSDEEIRETAKLVFMNGGNALDGLAVKMRSLFARYARPVTPPLTRGESPRSALAALTREVVEWILWHFAGQLVNLAEPRKDVLELVRNAADAILAEMAAKQETLELSPPIPAPAADGPSDEEILALLEALWLSPWLSTDKNYYLSKLRTLFAHHQRPAGILNWEAVKKILLSVTTLACSNQALDLATYRILALAPNPESDLAVVQRVLLHGRQSVCIRLWDDGGGRVWDGVYPREPDATIYAFDSVEELSVWARARNAEQGDEVKP